MRRQGTTAIAVAIAIAIAGPALAGCGDGDGPSYSNGKIVKKLNLKESEGGYAIDGDPFCEVLKKLLNDSEEIAAVAKDERGLVVASREGNVGVQGVPPFANDCREFAQKKLNRLDPPPKD